MTCTALIIPPRSLTLKTVLAAAVHVGPLICYSRPANAYYWYLYTSYTDLFLVLGTLARKSISYSHIIRDTLNKLTAEHRTVPSGLNIADAIATSDPVLLVCCIMVTGHCITRIINIFIIYWCSLWPIRRLPWRSHTSHIVSMNDIEISFEKGNFFLNWNDGKM